MKLILPTALQVRIEQHGENCYPEEGAGMLLGHTQGEARHVVDILPLENSLAQDQRARRYEIRPEDLMAAEADADARGLELVGVFHSHPDHPPRPSSFDLENALPWFAYLITTVEQGHAKASQAWQLLDDRGRFREVPIAGAKEEASP